MRYRKSIRIAKGVRINFSKSGISTTLGVRGASVNIGSKGTYLNTGIPGTGLYNRQKISGSSNIAMSTERFRLTTGDSGKVIIMDEYGDLITDESVLRRIKRSEEFKSSKVELMAQLKEDIESETGDLVEICKLSPTVTTYEAFQRSLTALKPERYKQTPFSEAAPAEEGVRHLLYLEAEEAVKTWAFWKLKKLRSQYVENEFSLRYSRLYQEWEYRKNVHELSEASIAESKNVEFQREYEITKESFEKAIQGSRDFIEHEIKSWIESVELPVDFSIQFEYDKENTSVMLDLDLPEIDCIPTEKAVQLASGQVKRKGKTQKEVKHDYIQCVYGLAVFFASHVFDISPVIKEVLVSGYTQRRNKKTGDICDDYIYSIKFARSIFEETDFEDIDILDFWSQFENRCLQTATYELKTIVPF